MGQYAKIVKETNPRANAGGYKNVFMFAPRSTFISLASPALPGAAIGDTVKITTAHAFDDPNGFISWDCKTASVTLKGATVGEAGAQEIEWTSEFFVLGDSASTQEQMQSILNDDIIVLMKEAACLEADEYVQLGDECVTPEILIEFDGKTTKEGKKEYKISVKCKAKYFYSGAVVLQAA